MKATIGTYVLENWVNGEFVANHLRYINRANKKYLVSDVQRTVKSYEQEPRKLVHIYKWATKFFKDNSDFGFRRSVTHLSNTDGVMSYSVFNSPAECKCKYTFDEVFNNDLRNIQNKENEPLNTFQRMWDDGNIKVMESDFFKLKVYEQIAEVGKWDYEKIIHLRELFNVSKVFKVSGGLGGIMENDNQSILTRSATLLHINTFGNNRKEISREDNKPNMTILFWLFDDKLVYQYESGKDTW